MLTELHVKNLALIDEAEVSFGPGLNILTGETGAGKSILIGSINLALGHKMSREMLRTGADSALVELIFQVENPEVLRKLKELDAEPEDGQLIITRKITDGRSICRLNGETCTAARIREISGLLLDIHGQSEHQSLLYADRQLAILDAYGRERLSKHLEDTAAAFSGWQKVRRELAAYQMDESERERELSFLRFEIGEIEAAAPVPGEDTDLERAYRRMANSRRIAEALGEVHRLCGYEDGAGDRIGRAVREIGTVTEFDEALSGMQDMLMDVDSLLNDFNREAAEYLDSFSFSEEEFYETEKRLDLLNNLKARYGRTLQDVLDYLEEQKKKLRMMEHFDEEKQALTEKLAEAEKKLEKASSALSEARKKTAEELSGQIMQGLKELNFLSVDFTIRFERSAAYTANGRDAVEFMISTNPGEAVRPLARVVSGGELSRIMLAIKTLLADRDETETLIFDEIDTGISGRTAQKVSEKMARIGKGHQVLCITHLAQIASMADRHYAITKEIRGKETVSRIRRLNREESVEELARILGGAEITKAVLENAGEMKELADRRKAEL